MSISYNKRRYRIVIIKNIAVECLSRNIRELRKKEKISQSELAKRINVSPGYITCIESGTRFPSSHILTALSGALGVSVSRLFCTEKELFPSASSLGWCKLRGLVEEVTICTEEMHEMLDEFQHPIIA
jgi:transcriptional regulator with XRE-family HTH domain